METVEYPMWVTKRYAAVQNRTGFVNVPAAARAAMIADGGAMDTFDDKAFVVSGVAGPPIGIVAVTDLQPVTTASPVGTVCGTLYASDGTPPYTWSLINDDGGNFRVQGDKLQTAKTGISVGTHTVTLRCFDSASSNKGLSQNITVTAPPLAAARTAKAKR